MCAAFFLCGESDLFRPEGVADRGSGAKQVVGVKLRIVDNAVVVPFRTNEESPPDLVTQVGAEIDQQMRAVGFDHAHSATRIASMEPVVEDRGLRAGSGHQMNHAAIADAGSINAIHVVEGRAEKLKSVIEALFSAQDELAVHAKAAPTHVLQADAGVNAALFRRRLKRLRCRRRARGKQSATPHRKVHILCGCDVRQREPAAGEQKQTQLSQS